MHELHESRHMWMDPVTDERVEKLSWNAWWWCIKSLLQQYAWVSTFVNGSWHRWASRFTLMTVTHTLTIYLGGSMHELHESGYIWMGHVTDGYVVLPAWSIEFMSHVWMSHVPCMNASTWSLQGHSAWWHRTERPHRKNRRKWQESFPPKNGEITLETPRSLLFLDFSLFSPAEAG